MRRIHMYDVRYAFIYFLARYFGIAECSGQYLWAYDYWVSGEDREDDCIKYFEDVCGIGLFPFKIRTSFDFGWDSRYRRYIKKHIERRQRWYKKIKSFFKKEYDL